MSWKLFDRLFRRPARLLPPIDWTKESPERQLAHWLSEDWKPGDPAPTATIRWERRSGKDRRVSEAVWAEVTVRPVTSGSPILEGSVIRTIWNDELWHLKMSGKPDKTE